MKNKLKIPTHLAIILDGNGRYAIKHHQIRSYGHKVGVETLTKVVGDVFEMGIKYLSVYCFSTENWKRDKEEVDYLMSLPKIYLENNLSKLLKRGVKVVFSGDISKLPQETYKACLDALEATKNCNNYVFNICFNYGSQDELVKACKEIANEVKENKIDIDSIDKNIIQQHLYTASLPPVDLLIRTSNELRISNYMLWQIAYAELYFTKTLWPSFTKKDLIKALKNYSKRDRRFGGVKK